MKVNGYLVKYSGEVYDGYMGFDDWDKFTKTFYFSSSKTGKDLYNEITASIGNKGRNFSIDMIFNCGPITRDEQLKLIYGKAEKINMKINTSSYSNIADGDIDIITSRIICEIKLLDVTHKLENAGEQPYLFVNSTMATALAQCKPFFCEIDSGNEIGKLNDVIRIYRVDDTIFDSTKAIALITYTKSLDDLDIDKSIIIIFELNKE